MTSDLSSDGFPGRHSSDGENKSPPAGGRVLYCRRCEGHGQQVLLKGHAPVCPFETCTCNACEKLLSKRMRAFEKRNGGLLASALQARRVHAESQNRMSSPTESEEKSSDMKAMTVVSYDIWKAKCAAEKRERERLRTENGGCNSSSAASSSAAAIPSPTASPSRKRPSPAVSASLDSAESSSSADSDKRCKYITLPTIPPMRVLLDENNKILQAEGHRSRSGSHSSPSFLSSSIAANSPSTFPKPSPSRLPPPVVLCPPSAAPSQPHSLAPGISPAAVGLSVPCVVVEQLASALCHVPTSVLLQQSLLDQQRLQLGLAPQSLLPIPSQIASILPGFPTRQSSALPNAAVPSTPAGPSLSDQIQVIQAEISRLQEQLSHTSPLSLPQSSLASFSSFPNTSSSLSLPNSSSASTSNDVYHALLTSKYPLFPHSFQN